MANEVAALNAYHNGANYSIARLYDGKNNSIYSVETKVLIHFDTDTKIIDDAGGNWEVHCGTYPAEISTSDISVSKSNAAFDFAWQTRANEYLRRTEGITLGGRDFTIDGWAYLPKATASSSYSLQLFTLSKEENPEAGYSVSNTSSTSFWAYLTSYYGFKTNYGYGSYARFTAKVFERSNGYSTWDLNGAPMSAGTKGHFAIVYQHAQGKLSMFWKGVHKGYYTGFEIPRTFCPTVLVGKMLTSNVTQGGHSYSEFRIVDGAALYTETFTPPNLPSTLVNNIIPVTGNVAFKSASGTLYAPLSSDAAYKTPPCLNVRHNGTNYFAIK